MNTITYTPTGCNLDVWVTEPQKPYIRHAIEIYAFLLNTYEHRNQPVTLAAWAQMIREYSTSPQAQATARILDEVSQQGESAMNRQSLLNIVKVAWIRDPNAPIGQPANGRLNCPCRNAPESEYNASQRRVYCRCGVVYGWNGHVVERPPYEFVVSRVIEVCNASDGTYDAVVEARGERGTIETVVTFDDRDAARQAAGYRFYRR